MAAEFKNFITAIQFFTRLPLKTSALPNKKQLNQCMRYFPYIGILISLPMAAVFVLFFNSDPVLSAMLMVVTGIFFTGAFHEDGLIDFFDGFGGGYGKEQVLDIMKDSRAGSYGVLAAVFNILIKVYVYSELANYLSNLYLPSVMFLQFFLLLVIIQSMSRWISSTFVYSLDYVTSGQSKNKFVARRIEWFDLVIGSIPVIIFSALFYQYKLVLVCFVPAILFRAMLAKVFKSKIGGYTGDCLGASQQMTEVILLVSFLTLWNYI